MIWCSVLFQGFWFEIKRQCYMGFKPMTLGYTFRCSPKLNKAASHNDSLV